MYRSGRQRLKRGSIQVDGLRLAYTIEGRGQPVVVVGSAVYYPRTFAPAVTRMCSLICLDLPHFVQAPIQGAPEKVSFDFYAECIDTLRATIECDQIVIMGHSHHGNVALEYASRYPQHVSHVVMIGSPPANISDTLEAGEHYWQTHASAHRKTLLQERRRQLNEEQLANMTPAQAFITRYVTDAPLYWNQPDYDATGLWQGMDFAMPRVTAFRDLFRDYVFEHTLSAVQVPVLVVMGRNDYAVPHTLWQDIIPTADNIDFHLLEHSGHTPQLEQADTFESILARFLGLGVKS